MSRPLYAVASEQKSAKQEAREAVKRHRKMKAIDRLRVERSTVREGAGMKWLPSWYLVWWKEDVIRLPKGETEKRLGYKS